LQPIAILIVAVVGVWVAARQMVIANDKLQMDKFDRLYARRVAVYEATRKILAQAFGDGVSESDLRIYGLNALDAQFLFDESMYQYLRQIRQRIVELNLINESFATNSGMPDKSEYTKRKAEPPKMAD
jgi:hypothetical protein